MSEIIVDPNDTTEFIVSGALIGEKGETGNTGANGVPGAVWYTGSGTPSTLHNNGDLYLNTANGDVYKQVSGSWGSPVTNIQGADGTDGTGIDPATFTDVGSVLQTVYNVRDYGAIGDGTTDDTDAIQAALDAANQAAGGMVYLSEGAYLITESLIIYPHVSIMGDGDGPDDGAGAGSGFAVTKILQTGGNKNGLSGTDVFDVTIQGICFSGTSDGTGIGVALELSFSGDTRYISMRNVTIQNFGSHGLDIDTPIVSNFNRVVCYDNGGIGFNIHATGTSAGTSSSFESCWAHDNTGNGWNIDHQVYSSYDACAADINGGIGFNISNCQSIGLNGCGAESNTGNPFKVQGASYNVSLISCWSFHNSTKALYVTGSSISTTIIGFHENTPTGSPTASIQVDSGSTGTSIIGYFVVTAVSLATGTTTILSDNVGAAHFASTLEAAGMITSDDVVRGQNFELANTSGALTVNAHYASGWKYIATGVASLIASDGSGGLFIYSAPSGTAGNAITFTERLHIQNGALKINGAYTMPTADGSSNQVLQTNGSGVASWATPSSGFTNPMTASGDIIYGGSSGTATRLAKGSDGKVLTLASGLPSWATPTGGIAPGDLTGIIVASSTAPTAWAAAATYTCDGTADDVQIQAAIAAATSDGRAIYLSPGTFNIATMITIAGDDVTDSDNAITIIGAGAYQTNLAAGTNVNILRLTHSCKVNISNIMFNVNGSGSGISSRAVTTSDPYRSFWNSSFKNLLFRGNTNQTDHTGWAMDLGSPFRSTFENIEAYNVANGIKLFSENAAFNPGDCTFTRCFMELGLNAGGIGYYLNGDPAVMNHCAFIICEAYTYGTTSTGIKMDGTTGSMWNRFIGTNLEQFKTVVDIVSGEGNDIQCNYITGLSGSASTIFKTEANAYNNRLQSGFMYADTSSTLWSDANTTTTQPNVVHDSKAYADTGVTFTVTTTTGSILTGNVSDGAGTTPSSWKSNLTGAFLGGVTGTASSTTYLRGDGTWSTPSGAGMTNPMTTAGDIIYGGTSGTPTRLGIGSATSILMGGSTAPVWTAATGTGTPVLATSPTLVTPTLGVATATSINKVTITAPGTSATLTLITGSSLITAGAFALTLTSTAATNATFPAGTHTLAGLDVAQTFTAVQTASLWNTTPQAATVVTNASTLDITHGIQKFTNSSAAAMTITLTTTSALDGQFKQVIIRDFSAVAEGITWVNTENSQVSVPTTSNGSTTLPLTVLFQYNGSTSKWRCIAVA